MRELRQGPDPEPQTSGFNRHWTSGSDSSGCFFRRGVAFNGKRFDRTAVTPSAFRYLRPLEGTDEDLVDHNSASWNLLSSWLRQVGGVWRSGMDAH